MSKQSTCEPTKSGIDVLIIASFFPGMERGRGPWSERFDGLYLKRLNNCYDFSNKILWYSISKSTLFDPLSSCNSIKKLSFYRLCLNEIKDILRLRYSKHFIIAYPCFKTIDIFNSIILILTLALLSHLPGIKLYIDYIDPPELMANVYIRNGLVRKIFVIYSFIKEKIILNLCHFIITNSDEMGCYIKNKYRLHANQFMTFPMGINVDDFSCEIKKKASIPFTVFYGGAISKDRGFIELLQCIAQVNETLPVRLLCCGNVDKSLNIIKQPWLQIMTNLSYHEYVENICNNAHLGVIPYPPNAWWGMVSISKLATYAAAGIPILTTRLAHTEKFLRTWDCGFVGESWDELRDLIIYLANHYDVVILKGIKARIAAEQSLDWSMLSTKFWECILE